jgi:hypothetical protein
MNRCRTATCLHATLTCSQYIVFTKYQKVSIVRGMKKEKGLCVGCEFQLLSTNLINIIMSNEVFIVTLVFALVVWQF